MQLDYQVTTSERHYRPWAICHLDHTQLDIELVSSKTQAVLRSIGCVGILKDWLTQTYRKALEEDASTLQPRHWESYAPYVAKCLSIAAEAIDGEKAFQFESGELAHGLRQKLGLSKVSSSMVSSDNSSPTGTLGQKSNRRPGVRQPNRDVIGGI